MIWDRLSKRSNNIDEMNRFKWKTLIGTSEIDDDKLKESTYFKCIKYLSESVAKCPFVIKQETEEGEKEIKNHKLYDKLKLRPNPFMTAIDVFKTFVALAEHEGVGGIYIDRADLSLYPCKINQITVDDKGLLDKTKKNKILIDFQIGNVQYSALEKDVILFKAGMTFDGINTKSNGEILTDIIHTTIKSQKYLSQTFDNGLTNKLVVQMTSDIKEEKELKKVQSKFDRMFSNNGRTFTVPAGYNVSSLNLSLSDAQFEQLRKLSRREIANAFGLSPSIIGDLEDSNNNNMEMQNLGFLVDTLLIKLMQIEQELDFKLLTESERKQGFKIRANQNVLLRTNSKEQSQILRDYVRQGIYTINDARSILGMIKIDGCDEPLVPSGTYKLSQLEKALGGEEDEEKE